ncbi:F-BAR domain only protein 1 [Bagarius yarrelli]|uniref:F-BAR domain only protein 1 n=1 Tax=Bagarius yarrelli TaxID=175774 RepID=A0A556V7L5_BAGYA|nr:F-BAR domain only protein 1 [Bagarius yarrelli]
MPFCRGEETAANHKSGGRGLLDAVRGSLLSDHIERGKRIETVRSRPNRVRRDCLSALGFDVLYHNMKHGQIATKELAEFVRERAAIEETYSKSMSKLAKMASNGSPLGTFAPMWDLFRMSSDKVALCHLELMRKMNDLIRDISKYSEEQAKVHRKTKEEVIGTVEAVQALQVQNGHLQKAREGYHAKCMDLERLRKEGAPQKELEKAELKSKKAFDSFAATVEKFNRTGGEFEKKMSDSAQKFQDIEDEHLQKMKQLIKSYTHSIEDTHVQVGQVDDEGFMIRADVSQNDILKFHFIETASVFLVHTGQKDDKENNFYSSDSDYDDEEPKKFHIQIRPVCSRSNPTTNELELKASVGTLTLPPNPGLKVAIFPPLTFIPVTSGYAAFSSASSSPENVEDSGLDSPSHQPLDASPEPTGWAAWPLSSQPPQRPVDSSLDRSPVPREWLSSQRLPLDPPLKESSTSSSPFPSFSGRSSESSAWSCKHIPQEDPFLAAFTHQPARQDAWVAPPPPRPTYKDPFAPHTNSTKTLPPPNSSSSRKDRERKRECGAPPPDSPDDPFAITMIGSPTHQSTLAAQKRGSGLTWPTSFNSAPAIQPTMESTCWSSEHNPFSEVTPDGGRRMSRSREEGQRRSGPPLTCLSGPQEDLCFSTDKDQDCLDISTHTGTEHTQSFPHPGYGCQG